MSSFFQTITNTLQNLLNVDFGPAPPLCDTCNAIFSGHIVLRKSGSRVTSEMIKHHRTRMNIIRSAFERCYFCFYLLAKLEMEEKSLFGLTTEGQEYFVDCQLSLKGSGHIDMDFSARLVKSGVPQIQGLKIFGSFELEPLHENIKHEFLELSPHTDSNSSLKLSEKWVTECQATHRKCNRARSAAAKQPKRLLDLQAAGPDKVKLWINESSAQTPPYVTLSHCWGFSLPYKLTAQSLNKLVGGIEITELPKSFQDAIRVARRLGVFYIWIDALCIIQESKEDWEEEASKMGDIYQGALMNIAATGAYDGNSGCFHERYLGLVQPCIIRPTWNELPQNRYQVHNKMLWAHDVVNSPLLQRGWVAQETALAAGVLHFGVHQIYWECHEKRACETYPNGLPENNELTNPKINFPTNEGGCDESEYRSWWLDFIESYSNTLLTRSGDKLIAIAGLAKRMQSTIKDKYLAGLWEDDLVNQLLWRVSRPEHSERPSEYRAPSWSWAAVDGKVSLQIKSAEFFPMSILAEIIHVETTPLNENSTGQVMEGSLRIMGLLKTMWIPPNPRADGSFNTSVNNHRVLMAIHLDAPSNDKLKSLHCLPVRRQGSTECLLLCPTGRAKGQFQRVGVSVTLIDDKSDDLEKPDKEHDSWFEYEEFDGTRNYTITIV